MVDARASGAAYAGALLLLGCASAPPSVDVHRPVLPIERPFERSVGATPAPQLAIDRWWTIFDDPQLNTQVTAALARSADLAVAAARLLAARAQLDHASGTQLPRLDIESSSGRSRVSAEGAGISNGSARVGARHRASMTADYELDLWGKLSSRTLAARERLQAQSLTAQVADAHFAQRATMRQLEIARAVQEGRMREVELRRPQVRAGSGGELELRRSEAELAGADAAYAALSRRSLALQSTQALLIGLLLHELLQRSGLEVQPLDPNLPFEARLPQGQLSAVVVTARE